MSIAAPSRSVVDAASATRHASRAMLEGVRGTTVDEASGREWRGALRGLRVAFAGGGTGGHIAPGRHLLDHAHVELGDVLWFCTGRPVETEAFAGLGEAERVALELEPESGGAPSLLRLARRTAPAVMRARAALRSHRSDVLLGLGGFTCLPAVLAARSLRISVALLEINAAAGRATRMLAPLASRTFHAWRGTLPGGLESERDHWTGPPLSPRVLSIAQSQREVSEARLAFGLEPERKTLVVLGGSQGALALNEFLAAHVAELLRHGVQVLHQTGPGRAAEGAAEQPGYRKVEFVRDMPAALSAATAVLCRGGASTLAEVAAARRPAWVVPYPHHADRHQERNARALGEGVAIVDQARLDAAFARELVQGLSSGGAAQLAARARALESALPLDSAERIWRELASLRARS